MVVLGGNIVGTGSLTSGISKLRKDGGRVEGRVGLTGGAAAISPCCRLFRLLLVLELDRCCATGSPFGDSRPVGSGICCCRLMLCLLLRLHSRLILFTLIMVARLGLGAGSPLMESAENRLEVVLLSSTAVLLLSSQ